MNDTFLYEYRRPPRPAFARALHRRITPRPRISVSISPVRQMARSVALMAATTLILAAVSPSAREHLIRLE
jgi:hypothetical protein